jgi:hypothetical protein
MSSEAFVALKKAAGAPLACCGGFAYPWAIRPLRRFCEDIEPWLSLHTEPLRRTPRAARRSICACPPACCFFVAPDRPPG